MIVPAAAGLHGATGGSAEHQYRADHHVDGVLVRGGVGVGQRVRDTEAGVVDQQVDRLLGAGQPVGDPLHVVAVAEVGRHHLDLDTVGGRELAWPCRPAGRRPWRPAPGRRRVRPGPGRRRPRSPRYRRSPTQSSWDDTLGRGSGVWHGRAGGPGRPAPGRRASGDRRRDHVTHRVDEFNWLNDLLINMISAPACGAARPTAMVVPKVIGGAAPAAAQHRSRGPGGWPQ